MTSLTLRGATAVPALLFATAVCVAPIGAQQTGGIQGAVTATGTGQPLPSAQVSVQGTSLGALARGDGTFSITNVPPGTHTLQAQFLGYSTTTVTVQVLPGQTTNVNIALDEEAIGLEGIVVTAAGEEVRRRELGNVVGNIAPDEGELTAVSTLSELLQGRTAGVTVSAAGGTVGTGSRIRVRGSSSVSLSNDPLIVIDGIRADNSSGSSSIGVGGQEFSRFEDINPADIENIEILKGPAATAMYGTAAAAGVIQISTRRGIPGEARWNAFVEQGAAQDVQDYPDNYGGWYTDDEGQPALGCTRASQAGGLCAIDSLAVHNPLEAAGVFRTGHQQAYGLNVSGGDDDFRYYVAGGLSTNEGVVPGNQVDRVNLRGNFNTTVRDDLDLGVQTGYTTSEAWLPQNDNNTLGILSGALLGSAVDNDARGWIAGDPPDALLQYETGQEVDRFIGSMDVDWRPAEWLAISANAGMDNVARHDNGFLPPNTISFGTLPSGERISNRIQVTSTTARLTARTTYGLSPTIQANTGIGGEFTREAFEATYASATGLLPGTRSLEGASDDFSVSEDFEDMRTIAGWIEQRVAWRDRVYLNLSLRADDDNSFGDRLELIWYPSMSLSWVMNEEEWFPETAAVTSLRLRTAFGQAGLRPGFRDAVLYFDPQTVNVDGSNEPGFSFGGAGNPDLRPEISTEFEIGFDAGLIGDRASLQATYFNKTSRDALVERRLAPSLGATEERFENLGEVVNQGVEFTLDARLLDRPGFQWNAGVSGSYTDNELTDLGEVEPIIFGLGGDTQRHQEGYPLGGYWGQRLAEVNPPPEGPVTEDDYSITEDQVFIGPSMPTRQISARTDIQLFGLVGVRALLDHQGGHYLNNSTRFFRCGTTGTCRELYDAAADPVAQAEALAALNDDARGTFIEPAAFWRLREVSVTLSAPDNVAASAGVGAIRLTLAGRNLATWTDYTGLDPEINFAGQSNFSTAEFLTQPPLRYFTARVSVDF